MRAPICCSRSPSCLTLYDSLIGIVSFIESQTLSQGNKSPKPQAKHKTPPRYHQPSPLPHLLAACLLVGWAQVWQYQKNEITQRQLPARQKQPEYRPTPIKKIGRASCRENMKI